MADETLVDKLGGFASAAGIDPSVTDGIKNNVIDAVASHVPGGEAIGNMFKSGESPSAAAPADADAATGADDSSQ